MSGRVVALVPMRHESERVPGKNYRSFAGRPLFHHVLDALTRCQLIDDVVVDTDSPTILESASKAFPSVRLLERPPALRDGTVPMNDVILHDVQSVPGDVYLQTHSTNPLVTTETFAAAIEHFLSNAQAHDSLFTVTRHQKRFWSPSGKPLNHDPLVLLRTQDLPPLYEENSCIYLFTRDLILTKRQRIGDRPLLFELSLLEAWDIDEEHDFKLAELLYLDRGQAGDDAR